MLKKDRLGSVVRITGDDGNVQRKSYNAFGKPHRADMIDYPLWQSRLDFNEASGIPAITKRGFTGHEHLDELQLVHMNGRVYDFNNPLSYTDPTGHAPSPTLWDITFDGLAFSLFMAAQTAEEEKGPGGLVDRSQGMAEQKEQSRDQQTPLIEGVHDGVFQSQGGNQQGAKGGRSQGAGFGEESSRWSIDIGNVKRYEPKNKQEFRIWESDKNPSNGYASADGAAIRQFSLYNKAYLQLGSGRELFGFILVRVSGGRKGYFFSEMVVTPDQFRIEFIPVAYVGSSVDSFTHTHPKKRWNQEGFSTVDMRYSDSVGLPYYVRTPEKSVFKYIPGSKKTRFLKRDDLCRVYKAQCQF